MRHQKNEDIMKNHYGYHHEIMPIFALKWQRNNLLRVVFRLESFSNRYNRRYSLSFGDYWMNYFLPIEYCTLHSGYKEPSINSFSLPISGFF